MEPLYRQVGEDRFTATELTRGPWFPGVQHGGPPAALLMRTFEAVAGDGFQVARFTMELLRPVPVAEVRTSVRTIRPGRRVQLLAASLWHGDDEVAGARAWVFARRPGASPPVDQRAETHPGPPPARADFDPAMPEWFGDGFHAQAVQKQFLAGSAGEPGPATVWMRLAAAVVEGEEPTPYQRAAAVSDFGNGVSTYLTADRYLFVNTDLTVAFARRPVGEWILVDAATVAGSEGMGSATARLADVEGTFGQTAQSLLIEPR